MAAEPATTNRRLEIIMGRGQIERYNARAPRAFSARVLRDRQGYIVRRTEDWP